MPLLEVKSLTTVVSGYRILNNLDFSVDENELRVLLGPNGAGKTTLISMITGQFKPTSGTIVFNGRDITGWAPDKIFLAGISRKFQVPNMYETLSVYDNVMVSLQTERKVFKYILKRVTPEENDRIWEILEFVDLAGRANQPVDTLSHGERQWLEMGMLIASNPKLMLLDEPTTGMTEEGKRRTADLIRRIARNHTVLLVEHDMHLVRQIANKVTVMHQGQVLAEGPLAEVVENEEVRAVYLGKGGRH
ncbi:MAG TPA: ATP-binding cassette domain-containing protein [Alphaproteobacteria bacterium]|nr:ATP-binding cassette domain-containing protein [Alphaproteobacteria bacterium]